MAAIPFMPFYVSNYLADTGHLSTLEHGAYMLLIMHYWQTGKPLPSDDKSLAKICRLSTCNFKKVSSVVKSFFFHDQDTLIHKRIEEELIKTRGKIENNRAAGLKSAEVKRLKKATDVQHPLNFVDVSLQRNANHKDLDKDLDKYINKTKAKKDTDADASLSSDELKDIVEIFNCWASAFNHQNTKLDEKRKKRIRSRLKEGFTVEELKLVIDGVKKSPWHMGANDDKKIYDQISCIFRDAEQVEKFISFAREKPKNQLSVFNRRGKEIILPRETGGYRSNAQ